jgi:hypothetical protein
MLRHCSIILLSLLACILAACGGSAPQLIGSYPSTDIGNTYQPPIDIERGDYQISYDTSMVLEMESLDLFDNTLGVLLPAEFGGRLVSNRNWNEGADQVSEFIVVVPSHRFNDLRDWLREQGTIVSETTFAHVDGLNSISSTTDYYSTLTLTVRPYGWVKVRNFAMSMFWVVLALIPPILMVIGLITIIRWGVGRFRRRISPIQE